MQKLMLLAEVAALVVSVSSLSVPPADRLSTKSGVPVCRYGLGGAARSVQPSGLPPLYRDGLAQDGYPHGAPFLFYYNPNRYPAFLDGVREVCASNREDVYVASGGTDRDPASLDQRLSDALDKCGGGYLDAFVLEYVCPEELAVGVYDPDPLQRLEPGPDLEGALDHVRDWVSMGQVRHIGISTHSHVAGGVMARHPSVDLLLLRYGISHKQAAEEVSLPAAREHGKPVIAFTTTRWNALQEGAGVEGWPEAYWPTTGECLSFPLRSRSSPPVEVVLHSARDEVELKDAMDGIRMGLATEGDEEQEERESILLQYGEIVDGSNTDFYDEYPEERFLKAAS
jgi:hypothetical protein